ncbi:hypothetical protein MKX01_026813 [Papaver californicum]|nr:hypothetical protein MKX01_026813 [Papaver californicum]
MANTSNYTVQWMLECPVPSLCCLVFFSFFIKILTFLFKRKTNYTVKFNGVNIVATLQLCHGTRCLIIQLLHLNRIPKSLRNFLSNRSITFVGVGITRDISKLDCDYGLKCWSGTELGSLADEIYGTKQFRGAGLVTLMRQTVGVCIEKPEHVTRSNWGTKILNIEQIKYATIDAYASFAIGNRVLCGYN